MTTRRDLLRAAAGVLLLPRHLLAAERPQLEVALKAERWIRTARIDTEHGANWPADPANPKSVGRDLYNGYPGVIAFLLELHHATGDRRFLDEASRGATELAAGIAEAEDAGLYTGLAGIGFVLAEMHRASGAAHHRAAARLALDTVKQRARSVGRGVQWSESADIISGSAGTGLYLLWAAKHFDDPAAVALAARAGQRLLEIAEPEHAGLKWAISPKVTNKYPNFSHGAAGVGYFLATLYQVTQDRAFLDGALAAARYLDAVARKEGDGWMVFHHEPNGEDLFYLSWCHGPPGTARLFYRLSQVTGDQKWLERVHACARGTMVMGVPEQRAPGFWNNISQCCGNAGVGEFFLSLARVSPRREYTAMVRRTAADTLARATPAGNGLKWIQAEHRVRPELLIAQTGFMQGAAGVGTYFLHMDALENGRQPVIVFPDNPFA